VYLKSITVKGFKSFPDRTRLDFGPGTSVIVGPNGSGKSNVTDAVLWALGEQSPVAVRGQSMQDVIFGGAPGRKAASSAEVELVLDDSDGTLGLGVPEISIYRRLDRSGDGEYRLSGARCRLIDVVELLSDTGLGKEMHSVISQGRVESLVTSKPRERRMLIEEAAGLGKHRKRRRRAQLKLARTEDNLDRALDVEREARARLRPLKRQAEAAELHERLERQALEIRWELIRDDVRSRRLALAAAQTAAAEVRGRRRALSVELTATAARREAAEEALATRSAHREELSRRAYAARSAGERIGYRAESLVASLATVEVRLQRSRQIVAGLTDEVAGDREDSQATQRISAMERELAALQRDRDAELARQLAALEGELARAQERGGERSEGVEAALGERRAGERAADGARQAIRDAERVAESARREAARVGGELAAVNQFLRNHAGTPHGASSLADALEVDPGYELAVAAALDGRLAAAVAPDRADAGRLLDRAGADGGRALVAGAGDNAAAATRWAGGVGAERLVDHVRGSGEALALARVLLDDTWVVADLAACAEDFAGVAVTASGRVWSARTRELRQSPAVGAERVLAERNRRDGLVADSERAVQAELAARAAVDAAGRAATDADGVRERLTAAHRSATHALDEARETVRRLEAQIDRRRCAPDEGENAGRRAQLTAEIAAERATLQRAAQERAQRAQRLERTRASVARDAALVPAVESVLSATREAGEAVAGRLESFDQALAADRQAGESAAAQLRECAQREAELHQRMGHESDALTVAEVSLQRSADQASDAEAELTTLAGRLELEAAAAEEELDGAARAALHLRLERVARRREQLGPVNPLAQEEYAEALEHVEELEAQRTDLETALRELTTLIADTDRQIRRTFEQTFTATAAAFEDLAAQLFPGGRGRLRLVSERDAPAEVIGGQALDGPADGAERSAGDDGEGSGGDGEAAAEAEESGREDLLGVEIEITPAGKDPKRLSLLSGGEKSMTALAFLFAVFLARPCPFYILDEVEAALDDLNISRFLTLLGQYSSRAQFIVVTHQKRTMEAADSLYGVSMASDGISKVISRRLPPAVDAAA
jgi:chromosome segregation protein